MSGQHQLSDLQLSIMQILWERGEASVTRVHDDLRRERPLAPTTVATVLSRLEKRGLVEHHSSGRQVIYRPLVSQNEVQRSMVAELTERLFQGDAAELVNHLLSSRDMDAGDVARVRSLLEARERELRDELGREDEERRHGK